MVNKKKYTAAIIGIGRIGYLLQKDKKREQPASHASALKKNKKIKLIAVSDLDNEKLAMWQKDYPKTKTYLDYQKMLDEKKPDIVVIAVDESSHLEVTINTIIRNPKLIILEKPIAPNLLLANKIKKYIKKYKVQISINHERRFSKDYNLLKKLLEDNKIGNIHSIHASLWSNTKVWHSDNYNDGACLLVHDGTHLIDIINYLFNFNLKNCTIDCYNKDKKSNINSLFLHYKTNNNILVTFDFSGNKNYFGFEIEIRGSSGKIIIGNGYFKLYKSKPSPYYTDFKSLVKDKLIKRPKKTKYFSNMIKNCIDFLDGKEMLVSPFEEGLKTMYIIEDIIKKLK